MVNVIPPQFTTALLHECVSKGGGVKHQMMGYIFRLVRKIAKSNIIFVMSLLPCFRPSARMEQLGSHLTDFHEIWYLSILRKSVEIRISLKSVKNKCYFKENTHF
jgi:hypothetical protein